MSSNLSSDDYRTFIDALAGIRRREGLTQAQVAGRLGKAQSWLSKTERFERRLDPVEFCALAEAMNLDPAALLSELRGKIARPIRL